MIISRCRSRCASGPSSSLGTAVERGGITTSDAAQSVTQGYVHIDEALKLAVTRTCEEIGSDRMIDGRSPYRLGAKLSALGGPAEGEDLFLQSPGDPLLFGFPGA